MKQLLTRGSFNFHPRKYSYTTQKQELSRISKQSFVKDKRKCLIQKVILKDTHSGVRKIEDIICLKEHICSMGTYYLEFSIKNIYLPCLPLQVPQLLLRPLLHLPCWKHIPQDLLGNSGFQHTWCNLHWAKSKRNHGFTYCVS